jgi:hypothetical protein
MTTKELLTNITENSTVTAEMAQKAQELLAKMAEEALKRAEKAHDKKSVENAPLIQAATALLNGSDCELTAAEIASALGIKTPKATAIAKAVEGVKVGEKRIGSRIVKTYSL